MAHTWSFDALCRKHIICDTHKWITRVISLALPLTTFILVVQDLAKSMNDFTCLSVATGGEGAMSTALLDCNTCLLACQNLVLPE